MNLESISEKEFFSCLKNEQYLFIAAISFEERCTVACQKFKKNHLSPHRAFLIDYLTEAHPEDLDKELRLKHRNSIFEILENSERVDISDKLNPYSTSHLRNNIDNILKGNQRQIVFDITCMTRPYLLSLASILYQSKIDHQEIYFCYAAPGSYTIEKENRFGWCDILLLPIGYPRSLRREGQARGIIMPGHDAERLSLALNELEPSAGNIIYTNTHGRPDIIRRSQEINISINRHLLSLKMPRLKYNDYVYKNTGWKEKIINLDDYQELEAIINEVVEDAKFDESPVILFPFGPKTLSLSAALILASLININTWAVYPIPYKYNIDSTQGSSRTYWMRIRV